MAHTLLQSMKRCWRRDHPTYLDDSRMVYGVPLVHVAGPGWSMSPAQAFGIAVESAAFVSGDEPAADEGMGPSTEQAMSSYEWAFEEVIDPETGGMLATAKSYDTSFFVKGLEYYDVTDPHRVRVVFSTASSNIRSRYDLGLPFVAMGVWESWADGHTLGGGKGMETTPGGLGECS